MTPRDSIRSLRMTPSDTIRSLRMTPRDSIRSLRMTPDRMTASRMTPGMTH